VSAQPAQHETRERLLDAAEDLFAAKGFESVSLREITSAAEANVAAVNYHFGSKEKLITAMMMRHIIPINEKRLAILSELMARRKKPQVREVVEAFMRPLVDHIQNHGPGTVLFAKFMGRVMGEEGTRGLPEEVIPSFLEAFQQVVAALQAAVPGLTTQRAYLRLKFCFAVTADAMMQDKAFRQISGGKADDLDFEQLIEEVLTFCEGGLKG
jgi:AcrR family transcriptional regulator